MDCCCSRKPAPDLLATAAEAMSMTPTMAMVRSVSGMLSITILMSTETIVMRLDRN